MFNAREYGTGGEEMAARFIEGKGFSVLDRNFRMGRQGEIDIVARKEGLVIFIEVKRRRSGVYGGPLYSISPLKKKRLRRIAEGYLRANPTLDNDSIVFRFDLLSIDNGAIEWVQDILR
jgi:putative endonuclease